MKKTVGQQVQEHNDKNIPLEDNVREYTNEMVPLLLQIIYEAIDKALTSPLYHHKNFYIVLVKNVDRVLGQPKFQCWARRSCPTPVYKQDVFKYHYLSGDLEFMWTIPASARYWDILKNKDKYLQNKETRRLARFVLMMESGELLDFAKKENGELPDAIITINN
jgi:hypothetical protein